MNYKVLVYTFGGIIEEVFDDSLEAYRMVNGEWMETDEMEGLEDE